MPVPVPIHDIEEPEPPQLQELPTPPPLPLPPQPPEQLAIEAAPLPEPVKETPAVPLPTVANSATFAKMHEVWELSEALDKIKQQQATLNHYIKQLKKIREQVRCFVISLRASYTGGRTRYSLATSPVQICSSASV